MLVCASAGQDENTVSLKLLYGCIELPAKPGQKEPAGASQRRRSQVLASAQLLTHKSKQCGTSSSVKSAVTREPLRQ